MKPEHKALRAKRVKPEHKVLRVKRVTKAKRVKPENKALRVKRVKPEHKVLKVKRATRVIKVTPEPPDHKVLLALHRNLRLVKITIGTFLMITVSPGQTLT